MDVQGAKAALVGANVVVLRTHILCVYVECIRDDISERNQRGKGSQLFIPKEKIEI